MLDRWFPGQSKTLTAQWAERTMERYRREWAWLAQREVENVARRERAIGVKQYENHRRFLKMARKRSHMAMVLGPAT